MWNLKENQIHSSRDNNSGYQGRGGGGNEMCVKGYPENIFEVTSIELSG